MINDSVYVGHRIAMEMLVYLIHHHDRDTDRPHPSRSACRSAQISLVKSALRTYDWFYMLASVYIFAVVWPAFVSVSRKQIVIVHSTFIMTRLKVTKYTEN